MRTLSLGVLFCLAACGSSDPGVEAAPAAPPAEAVIARKPSPPLPTVPVQKTGAPGAETSSASLSVEALAGQWRVTGVEVAPGPVSAVDVNDASLMGAVLSITPERLAWEPHEGGFFTDTCPDPQFGPSGSVRCQEGQFGPPSLRVTRQDDRLRMPWYDGAILLLSRVA